MMSESDFVDFDRNDKGGRLIPLSDLPKQTRPAIPDSDPVLRDLLVAPGYTTAYVNRGGVWNDFNRNWELAQPALVRLANEVDDFRAALANRDLDASTRVQLGRRADKIKVVGDLPWFAYLRLVESLEYLFVPNVHDASPRIITEAMSLNVPILLNRAILGGWKYLEQVRGLG